MDDDCPERLRTRRTAAKGRPIDGGGAGTGAHPAPVPDPLDLSTLSRARGVPDATAEPWPRTCFRPAARWTLPGDDKACRTLSRAPGRLWLRLGLPAQECRHVERRHRLELGAGTDRGHHVGRRLG